MRWSPDGSRLAGVGGVGDPPTTGVVDAGATHLIDPTRHSPKRFKEINQMWSPDGRRVAYNRIYVGTGRRYGTEKAFARAAKRSGVYVVNASGGTPRRLIASTPAAKRDARSGLYLNNSLTCSDWSRK